MRIRWTTRIAMATGVITLLAGIMVGSGQVSAAHATLPAVTTSGSHPGAAH
jgi:hypothetical protein